MTYKNNKIKTILIISLVAFSNFILLFVFLMQIVLLGNFYESYKIRQLEKIKKEIINTENISTSQLEDIAFNNGICVSVYSNGLNETISNIYNKGCVIGDRKTSEEYIERFVNSEKDEDSLFLYSRRFGNKTIVKAIKYDERTYIFLNSSLQPLDASIMLLKSQFGYIVLITLVVSIIISYVLSRIISKPIIKLSNSAKEIANGNFNVSFDTNTNLLEVKELANALELAKNELSKTEELRRDLMANVGHDLKTPLTMIKAYAEMTRDFDNLPEKKEKENLNIIIEETDRLNVLVSDILDLSKMQSKTYELKIEKFDLDDLIRNIIKRYYILIDNEGYEFIYNNKKSIYIEADKKRIEQVIYNLINNAINYTGEDKKVYINIKEENKKIIVEIKDTGKGIDQKDIKYIWNKYYHNEKNHKRSTIGTGLGLSIVKSILESHKYKYGVKSVKGKGSIFFFEINNKNML
ncbi:MAG: HAMP domain-containing histidine kinase [Bacilli bacterium]|nr:HAMP domain-containing histidine kinase [Bacilli bacterium]